MLLCTSSVSSKFVAHVMLTILQGPGRPAALAELVQSHQGATKFVQMEVIEQ